MISPFDNPPFAPDPACPCCNKPWKDHPNLTQLCQERESLLLVAKAAAKAAAIQDQAISQILMKVIGYIETPQSPNSPNSPKPSISDLLDDMEL